MGKSRTICLMVFLVLFSGCATAGRDPYNRAVEQYSKGRISESVDGYTQAMRLNPSDPRPKFNLAVIYQDQGRLDEAEKLYKAILEQHPGYAAAWANLASIQEKRGQTVEAEQSYRRAVDAEPDNSWTAAQFGYFLLRAERRDEAVLMFVESAKRNPRCANAWYGLGLIAEEKGDTSSALKGFDKTAIYNPSDVQAYLRAADIYIARGDRKSAVELLQKAVGAAPSRGDLHLLMGRLLREEGMYKEAEKALELAGKTGAPAFECDSELSIVYGKLSEQAAAKAGTHD